MEWNLPKGSCLVSTVSCHDMFGWVVALMYDIEHPGVTAALRYGYPAWAISYTEGQCDELAEYIEEEKWGDRVPGGWDG